MPNRPQNYAELVGVRPAGAQVFVLEILLGNHITNPACSIDLWEFLRIVIYG